MKTTVYVQNGPDRKAHSGSSLALRGDLDYRRAKGYAPLTGPHPGQQLDFTKVDEDLSFALLAENPQRQVVVAGGPFAGEPWPTGMLNGPVRSLRDVSYRVITPESQIEIKLMMPIWVPGCPRRLKDHEDVERIRRARKPSELP